MCSKGGAKLLLVGLLGTAIWLTATGCRSAYYSAYEKIGVYKRHLLKKNVTKARDEQVKAQEEFKDALTRLREITNFEGGKLEKQYNSLQDQYESCRTRAEAVRGRIQAVETVAGDLFEEWEEELEQIQTESLRDASREQLRATRTRYQELERALRNAEKTMDPVLTQFNDYVLYLKHNLNAQAIASLKGKATDIQAEIDRLLEEMNRSIAEANSFIKTLE
jgi:hypothetical protein